MEIVDTLRLTVGDIPERLQRPLVTLQPVLAKEGTPNIDLNALEQAVQGVARIADPIAITSPDHWARVVEQARTRADALLPVSIPAYPTEIWNSHPQPLASAGLPFVFWSLQEHDEPDFWRWSARDFLSALGVDVHLVRNQRHGLALLRALAMKKFLRNTSLVVIGEQNFPWNAPAAGHFVTEKLGTRIIVKSLADMRGRYERFSDKEVTQVWEARKHRYRVATVKDSELRQAVRTYLAIRSILEEEQALGFGVNCYGDLIINDGRDTPCLAQTLLREDGYIAACDGDYLAMMNMVLTSYFLDKPCMMSNMYPVEYEAALRDHFGDPLSPDESRYPRESWPNLARLGHCAFVGVVSPEMDPSGVVPLHDFGGTYEIHRDGRGCGNAGDLAAGAPMTVTELKFDARTLLIARGEVCETTYHEGMPHCEKTALLRFDNLRAFVDRISREHTVVVYGEHVEDYRTLAGVLGLEAEVF